MSIITMNSGERFSKKHPIIVTSIGMVVFACIIAGTFFLIRWIADTTVDGLIHLSLRLREFVDSTDKVIVVAMITGTVSIIGVIISSVASKIVDYRYNVKKYLYDKREEPYKQFIEMVYAIMEDTRKPVDERMTDDDKFRMISEFSKGLTLWGSNKVVKKWLKYRRAGISNNSNDILLQLEEIIYEIRKDVGLGRRLKKGDMLSFFINDVEVLLKGVTKDTNDSE